ncbi:phosphodiester glycosidase family protein [Rhizobium rhizogenes]|uniref:phosphodiester glycosidase family protein n=1 Tax=Rhizobium rhizogenes TaxID=359 RepID=UPI0022B61588|nr:phosphodiester glycosidase family protein [Rhizobium rhizogenes]MCZ7448286.1 phosphodiester glycosidase family protein [Rhizobium rhizogenes]MCZ7465719.1 phosphodiester glycosidase family protein [Rhizobium rhizogenes]
MPAILKETVTLSSGIEANIAIVHVEHFRVQPFNERPPSDLVLRTEVALATARLDAEIYPVAHPAMRSDVTSSIDFGETRIELWGDRAVAIADRYAHVGLTAEQLWRDRRGATPSPFPAPLAHTDLMRLWSASLEKDEIFTNANYFLFEPSEFDTPFEAYGDPIGMVVTGGVILYPPQVPRTCLVSDGERSTLKNLSFNDIAISLPGAIEVPSHSMGEFHGAATRPIALARYFGSMDGLTPEGKDVVEIAVVGRHAVALGRGGRMPIPRTGCVIRFPQEPDASMVHALKQGEPITYSFLDGVVLEGVQAGPRLVSGGAFSPDDTIFHCEGVFVEGAAGDLFQSSPDNWKADWHETRAARLGAGIDARGQLFLVAVEGQSSYSKGGGPLRGATLFDIAELLHRYGAVEGMHLDGGGSTQLFRPFGGSILRPGNFCRGFEDVEADYDRPLPLGLRLKLRRVDQDT